MSLTTSAWELISRARAPYLHHMAGQQGLQSITLLITNRFTLGFEPRPQNRSHSGIEPEPLEITHVGNRNVDYSAMCAYGQVNNIMIPTMSYIRGLALF